MATALGEDLLGLLSVPSVTGEERALADLLAGRAQRHGLAARRVGNSLTIGALADDRPTVLLVAHLDTVPPTDADRVPRREGDLLVGRGASDMKAGLAVALSLVEDPTLRAAARAPVLVCYAREEGPIEDSELPDLLAAVPQLAGAALAVVMEPTDGEVQLGCMGGLHAEITFSGVAAHSARPWQGRNALTAAGPFLAELDGRGPEEVVVDGLRFAEVLVATQAHTANARNVVPERFTLNLNYRFAPDKTLDEAAQRLAAAVGHAAQVTVVDRAPAAAPRREAPEIAAFLLAAAGAAVGPKQAWTDVARFAELGVPALNYGPGLTAQAHQAGEYVPEPALGAARAVLARYLDDRTMAGAG